MNGFTFIGGSIMYANRKVLAKRTAVAFIIAMMFFTFASRSIHYFMTPKVITVPVDGGYISTKYAVENIDVYSDDCVTVSIPLKLNEPIDVIKIYLEPGTIVNEGDNLVTFDAYSFDKVYTGIEEEIYNKNIELLEFEKAYKDKKDQLEKEIQGYEREISQYDAYLSKNCVNVDELIKLNDEISILEKSIDDADKVYNSNKKLYETGAISRKDYEKSLSELDDLKADNIKKQNDFILRQQAFIDEYNAKKKDTEFNMEKSKQSLQYLVDTGILNGNAGDRVKEMLKELNNALSVLRNIRESDYSIKSPSHGIAGNIYIEKNNYNGLDSIINIIPKDTTPNIALYIENIGKSLDDKSICELVSRQEKLTMKFLSYKVINRKMYLLFNLSNEKLIDYGSLMSTKATLEAKGEYCNMIIPNSAIIENNKVYVLEKRKGFWGEEYYASEQQVGIGQYNEQYSEITFGLTRDDTVIISWDREITDGSRVMIPIE